jgi:hypothetical protein
LPLEGRPDRPNSQAAAGRLARIGAPAGSAQVVRVVEIETADPALQGGMTWTTTLRDAGGGAEVIGLQGLPRGLARPTTSSAGRGRSSRRRDRKEWP